ncbi:MAG TPA: cysteine desulfurase-like protein [Blastocatellia bacterium]|jgi:cysteine desulfurase family protein (TIGR01976 family)|nr:cysteine desulfurase-like protein [Blastocatellia bacterium]HAF23298.1 cysteine desulfurase-like protein [Blastocatellia bacterium]HCX31404.1 cysteine desulfurase-like protein [Blastocatellia bacterium]
MLTEIKTSETTVAIAAIRACFPALERVHNQYPVAYFDGPGGTQVPRNVVEAMADYLYHHNANTHWAYPTSEETDAAIEIARGACAEFLNASAKEIVFGANMTTLTFHLARALGLQYGSGDEIVVTELDHHANVAPWHRLALERGVTVRTVKLIAETGQLDWESFEQSVTKRTKLVAIGAASNALGTINDVSRAIRMARAVGALVFVDAVHYAPHALVDVRSLDCDFLGMSAYKFYGPHVGVLFGKLALLESINFPKLVPAPDSAPENVETGTQNQEGMVGAAAAIDFLASLAGGTSKRSRLATVFDELHGRSSEQTRRLWEGLAAIRGVRLYGPTPDMPRTPTLAFTINGVASTDVARKLATRGLFLSHGDFYAATVVERLGLGPEGLVRAGCACYTTSDEIERLIEGVNEIVKAR